MHDCTIILTGGTGFLGSKILKTILSKNYNVLLLKRSYSNVDKIKDLLLKENIRICNVDNEKISDYIDSNTSYGLIHTATEYARNKNSQKIALLTNYEFPKNIVRNIDPKKIKFIINTDTYYNKNVCGNYLREYRYSKRLFYEHLNEISNKNKIINLRLEHVYGPNDSTEKFLEWAIQQIAVKKSAEIALTTGDQIRDFIFIDDVVEAFISVIENINSLKIGFHEYEVGTGVGVSVSAVVKLIKSLSNSPTKLNFGEMPKHVGE